MSAEKKAVRHINFRKAGKDISINIVILIVSLIMLFPLFWIMITACKGQIEILKNPLAIIPDEFYLFKNFKTVWERADWLLYYKNSILLTVCTWAIQMAVAIPSAYAFGILNFKGRDLLFILVLTRLMVSPESTVLANYLTVLGFGAYEKMIGVIMPYIVSAQAIFMFRQAFKSLPPALRESAKIDGCGEFRYMTQIALPLIKPYLISFSIITCVFQWNAFFWPMLIQKSTEKRVLSVALTFFGLQAESGSEWGLTMVAALIVITPLMLIFMIFQKKFINSFVSSGIK